jgi:hypothetical protein
MVIAYTCRHAVPCRWTVLGTSDAVDTKVERKKLFLKAQKDAFEQRIKGVQQILF